MRKMSVLFSVIVFAFLTGSVSFAQNHAKAMSNDDVVALVKAGLPDDTVINAIHAQETSFDNSASALVNLNKQGVSAKIIDAMLAAPKHGDSVATPPAAKVPAAGENATAPTSDESKPGTQNSGASANGRSNTNNAAKAPGSGFFGRLNQFQSQVNSSVQQAQGTAQQIQQGTTLQKQDSGAASQGIKSPAAPAQTATTATSATTALASGPAGAATVQATALQQQQAQVAQQRAAALQLRQQQIAERQKLVAKVTACKQQAIKDNPQGGVGLVKEYTSCVQAK